MSASETPGLFPYQLQESSTSWPATPPPPSSLLLSNFSLPFRPQTICAGLITLTYLENQTNTVRGPKTCKHKHVFLHNCILWFVTTWQKHAGISRLSSLGGTQRKKGSVHGLDRLKGKAKNRHREGRIVRGNEGWLGHQKMRNSRGTGRRNR